MNRSHLGFRSRLGGALVVAILSIGAIARPLAAETVTVVIRVPHGMAVPASLAAQMADWQRSGSVESALLLNRARPEHPPEAACFEAFGVLEFADEGVFSKWRTESEPAIAPGLIVRRVDCLAGEKARDGDLSQAVFIILTYTPTIGRTEYADYIHGYVRPLLANIYDHRLLDRYAVYLERGEVGKVQAYSFQMYRDESAFTASGKLKVATKAQLAASDPAFRHYQEIKESLASDDGGTFVSYCALEDGGGKFPHVFAQEHAMGSYRAKDYTLAQQLVDALTEHPEVEYGLIHARVQGQPAEFGVIASHRLAEVGAVASPEEVRVLTNDDSGLMADLREQENRTRSRYVLQMKDASGRFLPAFLTLYLYTRPADDQAQVRARAMAIRNELAAQIPNFEALFASGK
ncbi:MAG: ABC-type phosphate transport system, substrate-binding protein [Verrucomicrobia bacterium]|nr:ABC-type phosphate transport system, substrate-binding protein [Verrucomicrobiota bacterium]